MNAPVELFVTVRTTEFGNLTNNVTVTSKENRTPIKDNETISVIPANLTVVKSVNATDVSVGDLVEFTINVTNTGIINATDINVTDLLDPAFEIIEIGNESMIVYNENGEIIWNIGLLNVNASASFSLVVKVLERGTFNNTANVKTPYGNETNSTVNVTATKIPTHVSVENVTTYPGCNVTIEISVTSDDNKTVSGNITVYFPDGSNQTVEIINGTGNVTWHVPENFKPGIYNDTASYPGNETYLPSSGNGTVTVLPIPTHVSIGDVITYPGENVTIPINATIFEDTPYTGNVTVVMPDSSTHVVEIINGTGNITWFVPEDYTPAKYPDTVQIIGDDTYLPSNGTGIIEVVKIPTHISVGNVTTFAGREVTIPINVTADDGKPFNGNVTITLPDGSNKTVVIVNGSGTVSWFVPSDYRPDVYNDIVRFAGDNKYYPSEGKGTITVVKIPVDIIVGNITAKPGDKVSIPIEVIPRDGSLFNGNITVELPDGSRKVIEIVNNKGHVDWTVPLDYNGDYLVKAFSNETEVYYPGNGTGIITVVPDVQPPVDNGTVNPKPAEGTLASHKTANPIFMLLMVLSLLGIGIKRRK